MPPNKQETACGRHAGSAFEINDQKRAACPQRPEAQLPAFSSPPGNVFFIAAVRNPPPSF